MPYINEDRLPVSHEVWDDKKTELAHQILLKSGKALEFLQKERGVDKTEIETFRLGYDARSRAITVPVYLLDKQLHTIRFHSIHDRARKWSLANRSTKVLYSILNYNQEDPNVYICEGEPDYWSLKRIGVNAITSICGAPTMPFVVEEHLSLFTGKGIYLCFDKDDAGREASALIRKLFSEESNVNVIDWPKDKPTGYDVSDYIIKESKGLEDLKALFKPFSMLEAETINQQLQAYKTKIKGNPLYIDKNQYWKGQEKTKRRLSSFFLKPKEKITHDGGAQHVRVDFVSSGNVMEDVILKKDDFNSKQKFLKAIDSLDMQWQGSDGDVQHLMEFVGSRRLPEKRGTSIVGLHPSMQWVFPSAVIDKHGVVPMSNLVYVKSGNLLETRMNFTFLSDEDFKKLAPEIFLRLININEPHVILPIIGWIFACFLKPLYRQKAMKSFPILNIHGTAEAGKTATVKLFYRLLGFQEDEVFSVKMTKFASIKLLDSTNAFPLFFDEFKWDQPRETLAFWRSIARSVYGGEIDARGQIDMTIKEYVYRAPLAIVGEIALAREKALVERVIPVSPSPFWLSSPDGASARIKFAELHRLPLGAFLPKYCKWLLENYGNLLGKVPSLNRMLTSRVGAEMLSLRINENLMTMLLGIQAFQDFCEAWEVPLEGFEEKINVTIDTLVEEFRTAQVMKRSRMAFDTLVEQLALMAQTQRLRRGIHYEVSAPSSLFLHIQSCVAEFGKFARETNFQGETFDFNTYRKQIREIFKNREYIVRLNTVKRFGEFSSKKCIEIDVSRGARAGLDLDGFGLELPLDAGEQEEVMKENPKQEADENWEDADF